MFKNSRTLKMFEMLKVEPKFPRGQIVLNENTNEVQPTPQNCYIDPAKKLVSGFAPEVQLASHNNDSIQVVIEETIHTSSKTITADVVQIDGFEKVTQVPLASQTHDDIEVMEGTSCYSLLTTIDTGAEQMHGTEKAPQVALASQNHDDIEVMEGTSCYSLLTTIDTGAEQMHGTEKAPQVALASQNHDDIEVMEGTSCYSLLTTIDTGAEQIHGTEKAPQVALASQNHDDIEVMEGTSCYSLLTTIDTGAEQIHGTEKAPQVALASQNHVDIHVSSEDEACNVFHQVSTPAPKRKRITTNNISRIDSTNKPQSRKRIAEKFKQRNSGQTYVTLSGKTVEARTQKPLPVCRSKCKERLPDNVRGEIFSEYWGLGSRDKRALFVASLIDTIDKKTSRSQKNLDKTKNRQVSNLFYFKVGGVKTKVCRKCFMLTLGETHMFITLAISKSKTSASGVVPDDKRGKTPSANKISPSVIDAVRTHILSFPSYKSHYTRRHNETRYLPSFLNLAIMYDLYKETGENLVSRFIYEREFHTLNIKFKKPKVDTCHKCDSMSAKIKSATNDEEKVRFKSELELHHIEADKAYLMKNKDKEHAAENDNMKCYTFDLQQCLPTPYVNSSTSFYKRQLWTYNLTVHEMHASSVNCFMWHEAEGARGANQIAMCLYKELSQLPSNIRFVSLYSDSCGGQNRNSHVSAMFLYLMQNSQLESIDHKFMVSGHSHLECDVDHSLIEKQKKKTQMNIEVPRDWYQLVRTVGKKKKFKVTELTHNDFLDFAGLYKRKFLSLKNKDSTGDRFKWTDIRWLRYTKEKATVYFKCNLDEDTPFRKMCLLPRNVNISQPLSPQKCYNSTLAISKEKKKDLMDLLPLISPSCHDFYKTLKTADVRDTFPDIELFPEG